MQEYAIEMLGITKRFPGILANDNIDIKLKKGEILALLGENGAGKSTIMSILFGIYQQDEGEIKINGKKVQIKSPSDAFNHGIGMVHQHFKLVDCFSITENIILGDEPGNSILVDYNEAKNKTKELSEKYGLNIDVDAKIEDVSVGMQQRVEILKVLYRDAEIIILDEPTAVLTPQEIIELMNIMRNFIKEGKSIILITHKLKEILEIADRCTVIRRGKAVGTVNVKETNEKELAEMMVGREVNFKVDKLAFNPKEEKLVIKDLHVTSSRNLKTVNGINLEVRAGEILGIAGIDGNGQTELIEAITGLRKVERGSIFINGVDITNLPIRKRIVQGIAHIPEDRQKRGLVLDFRLDENLLLQKYYSNPFAKNGVIQFDDVEKKAKQLIKDFDVRSANEEKTIVRTMSGGNQQKTIIAREVDLDPVVMIASQPTRGLDVGAIEYIHSRLAKLRDDGRAILLVSFELDEILSLSDTIAVIFEGKIVAKLNANETDEFEIGLYMSGSKETE